MYLYLSQRNTFSFVFNIVPNHTTTETLEDSSKEEDFDPEEQSESDPEDKDADTNFFDKFGDNGKSDMSSSSKKEKQVKKEIPLTI